MAGWKDGGMAGRHCLLGRMAGCWVGGKAGLRVGGMAGWQDGRWVGWRVGGTPDLLRDWEPRSQVWLQDVHLLQLLTSQLDLAGGDRWGQLGTCGRVKKTNIFERIFFLGRLP